jgi:S-DNA-T family DNA segregation ATPase FtsK/SpoIIIE
VVNVTEGPVVTTFEFEPAPGTKSSKIVNISNDLARMLKSESIRVIPALPGKVTVGIEIPSEKRRVIRFGDIAKKLKSGGKELILPRSFRGRYLWRAGH